jgi:hypothetical protein
MAPLADLVRGMLSTLARKLLDFRSGRRGLLPKSARLLCRRVRSRSNPRLRSPRTNWPCELYSLAPLEKATRILPIGTAIIPVTEDEAFRQDVEELPDSSTLDDYTDMPVSEFGAAMLRGMGWTGEGKGKKNVQPWLPQSRPALLGIGAKEKEVFDDGSKKKLFGKPDKKYIPIIKKERPADSSASSRNRTPSPADTQAHVVKHAPLPLEARTGRLVMTIGEGVGVTTETRIGTEVMSAEGTGTAIRERTRIGVARGGDGDYDRDRWRERDGRRATGQEPGWSSAIVIQTNEIAQETDERGVVRRGINTLASRYMFCLDALNVLMRMSDSHS